MAVYCNDGFTLAEMIVERMSGSRYMDFLNRRIFKPLGLKNTAIGIGAVKGKPLAAYYEPKTGKKHPPEIVSVLGAGGLSATASDLCRFGDAFAAANRLFKKDSLTEMKKAQPSAFWGKLRNPSLSFGLGWDMTGLPRYDAAGFQVLGKSGGTGNFSSMLYTVPDKRISVAVIASGAHSDAMMIALDVLDAVLVDKKLVAPKEKSVPVPPVAQTVPTADLTYSGYYAGEGGDLNQVAFDDDKKSVTVFNFKGQEKKPVIKLVYNDGYYRDTKGGRYYFTATGEERYLVNGPPQIPVDVIIMQKMKPVKPLGLRIDMDGKVWLRRNVAPFESVMASGTHMLKPTLYKDLPGYINILGVKRIASPEFATMPFDAIRDQTELFIFERNNAMWAWVSDLLYSPAETAATPLKTGEHSVKIGRDGYTEWLVAKEDLIVSFTKPRQGRVIIFSDVETPTYDSALDRGETYIAQGSYIEMAGYADDLFTVKARAAVAAKK